MSPTSFSPSQRQAVAERSRYQCSYCQTQEEIVGMQFTIDHIIPESLGGTHELDNLCLACWDCNLIKQSRIAAMDPESGETVPLFHPIQQEWHEHFRWVDGGKHIEGQTAIGRATVNLLRLNRPLLVRSRERWIKAGWHPPTDS